MASTDSENKPNNTGEDKPKTTSKAKPRGRKPKAKAKSAPEPEGKANIQAEHKEAAEATASKENTAAKEKKQETEKPDAEQAPKKRGRPKGKKKEPKKAVPEKSAEQPVKAEEKNAEAATEAKGDLTPEAEAQKAPKKRGRPKGKKTKAKAKPEKEEIAEPKSRSEETPQPAASAPEAAAPGTSEATAEKEEKAEAVAIAKKKSRSRNKRAKAKAKAAKEKEEQAIAEQQEAPAEAAKDLQETPAAEENSAEQNLPEADSPDQNTPAIVEYPLTPGMTRVIIGSGNPAKVRAVELGFSRMFPEESFEFIGVPTESGVSEQPMSDDETFAGALMRAQLSRNVRPEASYWVGLEGGLEEIGDELQAFAWMVVLGPDNMMGKARTATFVLPPAITDLIHEGKELGEADDIIFERHNSKQDSGAVGILTHGLIDRASYYAEAIVMALIPFKNPHLYNLEQLEAAEA